MIVMVGVVLFASAACSAADAEPEPMAPISVVVPDSLGGREKIVRPPNDRDRTDEAAEHARFRNLVPTANSVVSALYRKGTSPSGLVLIAATVAIEENMEVALDRLLLGTPTDGTDGLEDVRSVDPGPVGGLAKCGAKNTPRQGKHPIAVCAWADRGSMGTITWPTAGVETARGEFAAMHTQVVLVG
ncbi:hypothetical protein AB0J48_07090 [Nocardia salmonicida]|uniref:hypothetical protein n=1 Tax=Nocardia TaxID=1817 RepID=UPI00265A3626|nr:hypothetical protein [Nocardia sp. PE-7]WKG12381.1 hypothetical protein QX204_13310 [Nocardia sp. PE-7]